jgi:hypothetical protein
MTLRESLRKYTAVLEANAINALLQDDASSAVTAFPFHQ